MTPRLFLLGVLALALASAARAAAPQSAPAAAPAAAPTTGFYTPSWVKTPPFETTAVNGGHRKVASAPGRMLVLVFLASWCEPCQAQMARLLELQKRYERLNTDFVFVFSHDTRDDAEGFMKEFGLRDAVMANAEALAAYRNPELPGVYVGDRRGYLTTRYLPSTEQDLDKLEELLKHLTAY